MCKICTDTVHKEMDVQDADLPYLPFTLAKWHCIVPGCSGHCVVRDYGIAPYYYWPVKVRHNVVKRSWRGGWFGADSHTYMCSKHFRPIMKRQIPIPEHTSEICLTKIVPVVTKPNKKKKSASFRDFM